MLQVSKNTKSQREVLIVTGMSGAGRSTVADALEDCGWYVVDNLPLQMLRPLLDLSDRIDTDFGKIVAVVDVRAGDFLSEFRQRVQQLRERTHVQVLFLEASDDALVRRFEEVRRPHPLQHQGTLLEGIVLERSRLREVREVSDLIVDTSDLNVHQLASKINDIFVDYSFSRLHVTITSFGFKYSLPGDAELVADMRFIPNPFWVPELRAFTGKDEKVRVFVLQQEGVQEFLKAYVEALTPIIEGYGREKKKHMIIAFGCTGGRHRSVVMAEELGLALQRKFPDIGLSVRHRDLGRQ